ncbi:MAG: DegT/DnrJ/EryC1/StrS family aminotransferase [Selenomonadaceae bacterium]|nr:DegT/DnrJ/EryC1/StrS family aminotransferase [Selenomonadaceae bacterium]
MKFTKQIFVTSPALPPIEEYVEHLKDIWQSRQLTNMGRFHQEFQTALISYLQTERIDLFTNGHMALELSLQALNLTGEVVTTPFTFASTTHAIVRNGLTPVFADIKPDDFTIDPKSIEEHITDRTSAIMPVHVYGNVCDVEAIEKIAKKYGLKVIYDAAHAFGVKYKNKGVAQFGDVSCFSFHATKIFHSVEGGAATFTDPDFGRRLSRLKNFGIKSPDCVDGVGANAKMNEFCAAMGLCNLRYVDEEIKKRKKITEVYREILSPIEGIALNPVQKDVTPNYAYFPVVIDERQFGASRNEVMEALAENGVVARKYFYPLTNTFDCFHGEFDAAETPVALHTAKRVLTLPLYGSLSLDDAKRIGEIVAGCGVG